MHNVYVEVRRLWIFGAWKPRSRCSGFGFMSFLACIISYTANYYVETITTKSVIATIATVTIVTVIAIIANTAIIAIILQS